MGLKMHSSYGLFDFKEVFEYKRGTRFTKEEQIPGEVPYVSSTKNNNGIDNFVNPPTANIKGAKITIFDNCLTLSNSGSVGYLFFHDYKFIASDHVTVIWPKDKNVRLNKNIAMYLKPLFESMKYKYNFGREISNARIEKEKIILPMTPDGKPDWQYMENYTTQLEKTVLFNKISNGIISFNTSSLNPHKWYNFKLTRIFKYKRGTRLIKVNRVSGDIPLITAGFYNNGFACNIACMDCMELFENSITIDMFGNVFWMEKPFYCDDNIITITPVDFQLNKYTALFIVTVLRQLTVNFDYGRQYRLKHFEKQHIKLPAFIDAQGKCVPDWRYMESFIKSMPYSENL